MFRRFKMLIPLVLFSVLLLILSAGCTQKPQIVEDNSREDKAIPAPHFLLNDGEENPVSLADFSGKILVLGFWTTWCPGCELELAEMERLHQLSEEKGLNIAVVGVNVLADGREKNKEGVLAVIEERGYTFPVIFDEEGLASIDYYVQAFPSTYIIDPDGNLHVYWIGAMEMEEMLQIISEVGKD